MRVQTQIPDAARQPIETKTRGAVPATTLPAVAVLCLFLATTSADEPDATTIEIKDIPAARVIFKTEKGAYWHLGQAYAKKFVDLNPFARVLRA